MNIAIEMRISPEGLSRVLIAFMVRGIPNDKILSSLCNIADVSIAN